MASNARFTCSICYESYNETNKKPTFLIPCGHTFCYDCATKFAPSPDDLKTRCPNDKLEFGSLGTNWEILKEMSYDQEFGHVTVDLDNQLAYVSKSSKPLHDKVIAGSTCRVYPYSQTPVPPPALNNPARPRQAAQPSKLTAYLSSLSDCQKMMGSGLFVFGLPALLIFPLYTVIFGYINTEECPANAYQLAYWLITCGFIYVFYMILVVLFIQTFILKPVDYEFSKKQKRIILYAIKLPLLFLFLVELAWFFVGVSWLGSIQKYVQFSKPSDRDSFCGVDFYRRVNWAKEASIIFLTLNFFLTFFIYTCNRCQSWKANL